jgi:hypothetical protein
LRRADGQLYAVRQAASKRPGFILLVVVKACRLPTLSDYIRRCELFGIPDEAARFRFREFITKPRPPETAAFPGKVFAVSNITIRVGIVPLNVEIGEAALLALSR